MKILFRNIPVMMLAILLLVVFSLPAMAKSKQTTIVATVSAEYAGCGNHAGSFYALYNGKKISVDFNFDRLKTELELCAAYGKRLDIAGKSVTILGEWGGVHEGVKDFSATEVYLTGGARKAEAPGDVEYTVTTKKVNNGKALSIYLNGKEIQFSGKLGGDLYSINSYPIKQGNKIAYKSRIDARIDNLDSKGWNGTATIMVANAPGMGVLQLLFWDKKSNLSTYHISFKVAGKSKV